MAPINTELDVRTALILRHPTEEKALLLRRSPTKRLFPNLMTGVGGKVELEQGEGSDLAASMWREFTEETTIPAQLIEDARLRLSTIVSRGSLQVLLLWYTGRLLQLPNDLSCTEGQLEFHPVNNLPLDDMIPTARMAIPFILALPDHDETVYNGCLMDDGRLITNSP